MGRDDPSIRRSVTLPASLDAAVEAAISDGAARHRTEAVQLALQDWIAKFAAQQLREAAGRLSDVDSPEEEYAALRTRP